MNSKTKFESLSSQELQHVEGGAGILDDIRETISDAIDAIGDFIHELTCTRTRHGLCEPDIKTPPGF